MVFYQGSLSWLRQTHIYYLTVLKVWSLDGSNGLKSRYHRAVCFLEALRRICSLPLGASAGCLYSLACGPFLCLHSIACRPLLHAHNALSAFPILLSTLLRTLWLHWAHPDNQNNRPYSRSLITYSNHLPCQVTYSRVRQLGYGHLWGTSIQPNTRGKGSEQVWTNRTSLHLIAKNHDCCEWIEIC